MHAAIRHLLLKESRPAWNTKDLGLPVNQEDLAGTLLLFSYSVLEGLEKFGVWIDPKERQGYFKTWQIVGQMMGVVRELIPADLDEAAYLSALIRKRQLGRSQEGRDMLRALLRLLRANTPLTIIWAPAATMRYLLPAGVANVIGVPREIFGSLIIWVLATLNKLVNMAIGPCVRPVFFHRFGLQVAEWLIDVDRGSERAHFYIPTHLRTYWSSRGVVEKTFLQRLLYRPALKSRN
jgi:hypothetical protein